jgi:tRNA A37 threonylcarbamoyladenosine synthetase subunit TsaC/SUA5/YrdC
MPLEQDAAEVYATLREGGLALVPTDVGYGLVAMEEAGVRRVYELKGRPLSKPCITVANITILRDLVLPIDDAILEWITEVTEHVPLAVIAPLDPASDLLAAMPPYVRAQATQNGTIATFHAAGRLVHRIADLAFADRRVIVGSSANTSGTGNNYAFEDVPEEVRGAVDLALDRGRAWFANDQKLASTILDLRTGAFQRRGIEFTRIERSWSSAVGTK